MLVFFSFIVLPNYGKTIDQLYIRGIWKVIRFCLVKDVCEGYPILSARFHTTQSIWQMDISIQDQKNGVLNPTCFNILKSLDESLLIWMIWFESSILWKHNMQSSIYKILLTFTMYIIMWFLERSSFPTITEEEIWV